MQSSRLDICRIASKLREEGVRWCHAMFLVEVIALDGKEDGGACLLACLLACTTQDSAKALEAEWGRR